MAEANVEQEAAKFFDKGGDEDKDPEKLALLGSGKLEKSNGGLVMLALLMAALVLVSLANSEALHATVDQQGRVDIDMVQVHISYACKLLFHELMSMAIAQRMFTKELKMRSKNAKKAAA